MASISAGVALSTVGEGAAEDVAVGMVPVEPSLVPDVLDESARRSWSNAV